MQTETDSEAAERIRKHLEQEVRSAGDHGPLLFKLILHQLVERQSSPSGPPPGKP
jgi:hypothetical protein